MRSRALALGLLAALVGAAPAAAQIFRWTDERGTTHYSEGIDSIPLRYRGSAVPLGLRNSPATPASSAGEARTPSTTVIRYTPGQPIMVDVRINDSGTARLLLDTGADRTMISPRALVAAGVRITRPVATGTVTGVTGSDRIDYVVVDSLEVGEARVTRLPVAAYEIAGGGAGDGLLGRDFLDRFDVSIDGSRGEVTLRSR